jgi:hypothetical protein
MQDSQKTSLLSTIKEYCNLTTLQAKRTMLNSSICMGSHHLLRDLYFRHTLHMKMVGFSKGMREKIEEKGYTK